MPCNYFKTYPQLMSDAAEIACMPGTAEMIRAQPGRDHMIGGEMVFMCGKHTIPICARPECAYAADFLCDYPMGGGRTCDLAMCRDHRRNIGPERDLCEIHYAEFQAKARVDRINPWPPVASEKSR